MGCAGAFGVGAAGSPGLGAAALGGVAAGGVAAGGVAGVAGFSSTFSVPAGAVVFSSAFLQPGAVASTKAAIKPVSRTLVIDSDPLVSNFSCLVMNIWR